MKILGVDHNPEILIQAARGLFGFSDYGGRLGFFEQVPEQCEKYFLPLDGQPDIFKILP